MKVSELIALLSKLDPDLGVVNESTDELYFAWASDKYVYLSDVDPDEED